MKLNQSIISKARLFYSFVITTQVLRRRIISGGTFTDSRREQENLMGQSVRSIITIIVQLNVISSFGWFRIFSLWSWRTVPKQSRVGLEQIFAHKLKHLYGPAINGYHVENNYNALIYGYWLDRFSNVFIRNSILEPEVHPGQATSQVNHPSQRESCWSETLESW